MEHYDCITVTCQFMLSSQSNDFKAYACSQPEPINRIHCKLFEWQIDTNKFANCPALLPTRHSTIQCHVHVHGSRPMFAVSFSVVVAGQYTGGCGCGPRRVTVTAERSLSTWPSPAKQKIIIIMQVSRGGGVFNGCRPQCLSGVLVTSCVTWVTRDVAIARTSCSTVRWLVNCTPREHCLYIDNWLLTCHRASTCLLSYLLNTLLCSLYLDTMQIFFKLFWITEKFSWYPV